MSLPVLSMQKPHPKTRPQTIFTSKPHSHLGSTAGMWTAQTLAEELRAALNPPGEVISE